MPAAKASQTENPQKPPKEDVLFSWTAPERPFKRRSRDFYVTIISIAVLFGVVIFLIEQSIMPILLMISLLFLFYVLSTVEPKKIECKITTFGIRISDELIYWDELGRFWFTSRFGSEVVAIERASFAGRIELVVDSSNKNALQKNLEEYLSHEEVPASYLDKTVNWLSEKLPSN